MKKTPLKKALLKTLQKLCELESENMKLKNEIRIYKDLFIKEAINEF